MGRLRQALRLVAGLGVLITYGLPLLESSLGSSTMPVLRTAISSAARFGKDLEPWVIGLLVLTLVAQLVALWAWRQRRRLVDQIAQLLKIRVDRGAATVRVGLRAPRGGTVPVSAGHVFADELLDGAGLALARKWGKPYTVTHDERRDRVRIKRLRHAPVTADIAPEQYIDAVHERLVEIRDQLPLSVTKVDAEIETDEDGTEQRFYRVHYTPNPKVTVRGLQDQMGRAILALVGEPEGTPLDLTWDVTRDTIVLIERPRYVDAVHERLVETTESWPVKVRSLEPVPETMFDGTPTTSYKIGYEPNAESTKAAWQRAAGESIAGLVGATPTGTRLVSTWHPPTDTLWLREVPILPKRLDHPVISDYPSYLKERSGDLLLPFGLTDTGFPAVWNIGPECGTPHALITGGTGKGKTTAERTVITSALRRGIPVILIDPKTFELIQYHGTPGVLTIASQPDHIAAVFETIKKEINLRELTMAREQLDNRNLNEVPLFVIVIDEFFVLAALMTEWTRQQNAGLSNFDGARIRNPIEGLSLMIMRIRAIGGRFLFVTQRADAAQWGGGAARDSLSMRLAMSRQTRDGDEMMFDGLGGTQHLDESIIGRGVSKLLTGDVSETQVWWTPNMDQREKTRSRMKPEDRRLVDSLRPPLDMEFRNGLFLPAADAEPLLRPPAALAGQELPTPSPYASLWMDGAEQRYVRELRPGMRIVVGIEGELVPALLIDIDEDGPMSELEVRLDGERTTQTVAYDRDDVLAVLPGNAE